jgi:dienelactone hydrolase
MSLGDLPIAVTYPKDAKGKLPVIVWSHGMYGTRNTYKPLVDALAGNGYVVIQPSHGDSVERMTPEQRRALVARPNTGATHSWDERPGEVSLCLDSFGMIEGNIPALKGKLDPERIGVGGHSFGAWTTQALAGMELSAGARKVSFYEKRAKAFVVLSGTGPGGVVTPAGLKAMHGPMLMITGTNDTARTGDTGEWRKKAFEHAAPGDKYLVWIDGATHNFGGITGERTAAVRDFLKRAGSSADVNAKHTAIVISSIVAFYDAFVVKDAAASSYVRSKTIEKAGGVTVSSK